MMSASVLPMRRSADRSTARAPASRTCCTHSALVPWGNALNTSAALDSGTSSGAVVTFQAPDDVPLPSAALVFSALPHGTSAEWVQQVRDAGARAVDLSADLRIGNTDADIIYGLTEARRDEIRGAELVANPGCFPTSILLGLLPLLEQGLVAHGATINVSAASGATGAGLTPRADLLFGEIAENFRAYGIGNTHRHLSEMRAFVAEEGVNADLGFTPHLLPTARGILATMTVPLTTAIPDPLALWQKRFHNERFVEIVHVPPETRHVAHRNVVRITAHVLEHLRQPTLLVLSAIDNLMKGAAGQALQNANLMLGLDEAMGLPA